jgi:hypothetical protein
METIGEIVGPALPIDAQRHQDRVAHLRRLHAARQRAKKPENRFCMGPNRIGIGVPNFFPLSYSELQCARLPC